MKEPKYGLFCGDFHCGHLVGLTPPDYQIKSIDGISSKHNKFFQIQKELWLKFADIIDKLPELDFAVFNGDLIDGKGLKSGGTEQITTDMNKQCDMAVAVIDYVRNKCKKDYKFIATYGTDYHVGTGGDDWENIIAERAHLDKIGSHEWLDVNGLVFDIKHHLGSSGIPTGRHSASAREGLWNDLWSLSKMQPKADVIIRSHVHYYTHCANSSKLCMTLPALQGMGSKYGSRRCSGTVDWGVVLFEIKDKNDFNFYPYIHNIKSQMARAMKI